MHQKALKHNQDELIFDWYILFANLFSLFYGKKLRQSQFILRKLQKLAFPENLNFK